MCVGGNFVRGLLRQGKFWRWKILPPWGIPHLALPHAHTALPEPKISPGEKFATFFRDELFPRNYLPPPPPCLYLKSAAV